MKRRWRQLKKGHQLFWGKKCIRVTWLDDFLTSIWPGSFTALVPPLNSRIIFMTKRSLVRLLPHNWHYLTVIFPFKCQYSSFNILYQHSHFIRQERLHNQPWASYSHHWTSVKSSIIWYQHKSYGCKLTAGSEISSTYIRCEELFVSYLYESDAVPDVQLINIKGKITTALWLGRTKPLESVQTPSVADSEAELHTADRRPLTNSLQW